MDYWDRKIMREQMNAKLERMSGLVGKAGQGMDKVFIGRWMW